MLKRFLSKLKKKNQQILVVPAELAEDAKELAKAMDTSSIDTIKTGLELLRFSLGREVLIRESNKDIEMKIPIFKRFKSITHLEKLNESK